MCGITGFVDSASQLAYETYHNVISGMTEALKHRGPDDSQIWVDNRSGVVFGHSRLSIIDLSSEGQQPMFSACGRYVLVFNGEVYNFQQLRTLIEMESSFPFREWRGRSDTEVMLAAISLWGVNAAIEKLNGMFAFALWDKLKCTLYLARDRLGEKPLYYGNINGVFVFASELKSLKKFPLWAGEVNRNALTLFVRYGFVPAPHCIIDGLEKLMPGTLLSIDFSSRTNTRKSYTYWSLDEVYEKSIRKPYNGNELQAISELDSILRDSVSMRLESDVPLGAFLSGGIDSSLIVALMKQVKGKEFETFSIGYEEDNYNEACFAKKVAAHLEVKHTELYVKPQDALDVIPDLPLLYDEPFADSSQIPTYILSKLARNHIKVALSGDGGDELFAGYSRHLIAQKLWKKISLLPFPIRFLLSDLLKFASTQKIDGIFIWVNFFLKKYARNEDVSSQLLKISEVLLFQNPLNFYKNFTSHWKNPSELVCGGEEPETIYTADLHPRSIKNPLQNFMYADAVFYLPDDVLVKLDRATMSVGLEARVPFLDHRVVEFSYQLPLSMKFKGDKGKWLLRQLLYKYVPKELVDRPKHGFGVPIGTWLRGPLREWAEDLLGQRKLQDTNCFEISLVRDKWRQHINCEQDWSYHLWDILMFQAWYDAR